MLSIVLNLKLARGWHEGNFKILDRFWIFYQYRTATYVSLRLIFESFH